MKFYSGRIQHPVGQGFFQSGVVEGKKTFRYVYDCGAMSKYTKSRDAAISAYLSDSGLSFLDVMFISHAHADHLNGLQALLGAKKKLPVGTFIMPLLEVEERLLAYGRTAMSDPKSASAGFYREFVVDPTAALGRFKPDRIIYVRRGEQQGGAPYRDGPDDPPVQKPETNEPRLHDKSPNWSLIGRGVVEPGTGGDGISNAIEVLVMDDTLALVMKNSGVPDWLLVPYVDPVIEGKLNTFVMELAKLLGLTKAKLQKSFLIPGYIKDLLLHHTPELRAAYGMVASDLNMTSMCLYSGPVVSAKPTEFHYCSMFGVWAQLQAKESRVAWLGTGDAALANEGRRDALVSHYGRLLELVGTLTLPHHGSDHNFHPDLLQQIRATMYVASADNFSNWRHPGTSVAQAVASVGRFVSVVTSNPESIIVEVSQLP